MKMRWYDRILVSLGGLVLIALGVLVMLAGGGVVKLPEPFALDTWLGTGWQWMPLVFLAGLLLIAWGLWLFLRPILRRSESGGQYYTVHDGGEDSVHISVQALDHLVHKCLDKRGEILSANVKISGQEEAMRILLRITVRSGVTIPALVTQVRAEIKRYVEQCAGVTVESVRIVVEATKEARGAQQETEALPPAQEPESFAPISPEPPKTEEPIKPSEPAKTPEPARVRTIWQAEAAEPVDAAQIPEEERTFVTAEREEEPEAVPIPLAPVMEDDIPDTPSIPLSSHAFPFPGEDTPVWNPSTYENPDAEEGTSDA